MRKFKTIPKFNNEDEERDFWDNANVFDYFDINKAVKAQLPNLKFNAPETKPITIRMPAELIQKIKKAADKRDVPYQSLIKVWLADRVAEEPPEYAK